MANPRRTATIMSTVAAIEADPGPAIAHYAIPLDRPALYRFSVGDSTTVNHTTVLGCNGGTSGRWLQVSSFPNPNDLGANLTNADVSITLAQGRTRKLPSVPLTANHTCTLLTTDAGPGDELTLVMLDVSAWTYAIINGGVGAGTLFTKAAGQKWFADFAFDGTNWWLKRAGQLP